MEPSSDHSSLLEKPSIQPCILNPNGFHLSWPSICHIKFGPLVWYARRRNLFLLLLSTPSGSSSLIKVMTVALLTIIPFFLSPAHILRYPTKQPLLPSSSSIAFLSSSSEIAIFRDNPRHFNLLFRVDRLMTDRLLID